MIHPIPAQRTSSIRPPAVCRLRQLHAGCKTTLDRSMAPAPYVECVLVAAVIAQNID